MLSAWGFLTKSTEENSKMSKAKPIVLPAFSDKAEHWADINWRQVHRHVRGLQVRIAKATKAQDWRRVKALQR